MNKNLRKIIAVALAFTAFSTVSLSTNFGVKPAYARSYSAKSGELDSLSIKSTNGKELDLRSDSSTGEIVDLSHDLEYFIKLTDKSEGIKIKAKGEGSNDVVKVFLSSNKDATPYDVNETLPISKGESDVIIRTYDDKSDFGEAKRAKDYTIKCKKEYTIHVLKTQPSSDEDTSQDAIYLESIELGNGKSVDFLKTRTKYDVKVSSDVENIKIIAKPVESSTRVLINGKEVKESDNYKEIVDLRKGKNEIKIKLTDTNYNVRTYVLNIVRGSESDTEQDDIYLDKLELNEGDIDLDFYKEDDKFTKDVKNSVEKVKITAEPENDNYTVTVDGKEVYYKDDYEIKVSLKEGKNEIPVIVKDEINDLTRKYTLIINREKSKNDTDDKTNNNSDKKTENTNNNTSNTNSTISSNWVKDNNGYQYKKDGVILKNQWILDEVSKQYYYVKEDGYRHKGWKQWNGTWYLLDSNDGVMLTSWRKDKDTWYYLNEDGSMKTGWLKDPKNGLWYYLNGDGSLKTGWLPDGSNWYYLQSGSGEMKTGWITDGGKKYYLNSPNGDMATGTKTIDGKNYQFDGSGALIG